MHAGRRGSLLDGANDHTHEPHVDVRSAVPSGMRTGRRLRFHLWLLGDRLRFRFVSLFERLENNHGRLFNRTTRHVDHRP